MLASSLPTECSDRLEGGVGRFVVYQPVTRGCWHSSCGGAARPGRDRGAQAAGYGSASRPASRGTGFYVLSVPGSAALAGARAWLGILTVFTLKGLLGKGGDYVRHSSPSLRANVLIRTREGERADLRSVSQWSAVLFLHLEGRRVATT